MLECIKHHVLSYSDSYLYWYLAYICEGIFHLRIYVTVTSPYPRNRGVTRREELSPLSKWRKFPLNLLVSPPSTSYPFFWSFQSQFKISIPSSLDLSFTIIISTNPTPLVFRMFDTFLFEICLEKMKAQYCTVIFIGSVTANMNCNLSFVFPLNWSLVFVRKV